MSLEVARKGLRDPGEYSNNNYGGGVWEIYFVPSAWELPIYCMMRLPPPVLCSHTYPEYNKLYKQAEGRAPKGAPLVPSEELDLSSGRTLLCSLVNCGNTRSPFKLLRANYSGPCALGVR